MVGWRTSALPLHPTEAPLTPSPIQAQGLTERIDEWHAGTRTVTCTHPHQVRQPASTISSARARIIAPVRGQGRRKGQEAQFQETQEPEREGSETDLKMAEETAVMRCTPTTQTHTHTQGGIDREGDTEPVTEGNGRQTGERMVSDLKQTCWHRQ